MGVRIDAAPHGSTQRIAACPTAMTWLMACLNARGYSEKPLAKLPKPSWRIGGWARRSVLSARATSLRTPDLKTGSAQAAHSVPHESCRTPWAACCSYPAAAARLALERSRIAAYQRRPCSVHQGDCGTVKSSAITREQAVEALMAGVEACGFCRPDIGLGLQP